MREKFTLPQPDELVGESPDTKKSPRLNKNYSKEINKYKLLSPEEEAELAIKIKNGDEEALELLINSNLKLVLKIAYRYTKDEEKVHDLIQEGNLGLITAAKKFDPSYNIRFATYAAYWITAYITRYLEVNTGIVKISKKQSKEMREIQKNNLSMDAPLPHGDGEKTLHDVLISPDISPEDATQKNEESDRVYEEVSSITNKRNRTIIEGRLLGDKTLTALGEELGVSRERVRQIELDIKRDLAESLKDLNDAEK